MNLQEYNVSQATHKLQCAHCIGHQRHNYTMPCIVLGRTKSHKVKIIVFGDRYWKNTGHVKRVKYVSPLDVKPIIPNGKEQS
jgi:hypothetical protein